jgi:DNA-directed RNA polymerase specialized sigma24 family protein
MWMRLHLIKVLGAIMLFVVTASPDTADAQAPILRGLITAARGERAAVAVAVPRVTALGAFSVNSRLLENTTKEWSGAATAFHIGAVQESDVTATCTEESGIWVREQASARLMKAVKINLAKKGSPSWRLDDDAQDVMVKILAACTEMLSGRYDNIPAIVYSIIARDGIDKGRKKFKEVIGGAQAAEISESVTPRELQVDPHAVLEARDILSRLELTEREQEVVSRLHFLDQHNKRRNTSEIADELGVTHDRVREIYGQVIKKCLKVMGCEGNTP